MPHEVIRERAIALGFDPYIALSVAEQESAGGHNVYGDPTEDPRGVVGPGDRRFASLGAFQENVVGGAGETHLRRGGSLADLFDPLSATDRFIDRYRDAEQIAFLGSTPGEIAALAQRPADPQGYARSVDTLYAQLANPGAPIVPSGSCGLDAASMLVVGDRLKAGHTPQQIADDLSRQLGRKITVECLRVDAYRGSAEIGRLVDAASGLPVVGGAAQAVVALKDADYGQLIVTVAIVGTVLWLGMGGVRRILG